VSRLESARGMGSPFTWLTLKLVKKWLVVRANVPVQTIVDNEKEIEVVVRTLLVLGKSIWLWIVNELSNQGSSQASSQASKQASKQASRQTNEQDEMIKMERKKARRRTRVRTRLTMKKERWSREKVKCRHC